MKRFWKRRSILDDNIERVMLEMQGCNPGTDDYTRLIEDLERLLRLKKEEKSGRVSPDTILIVAGNLAGIVIIVGYERTHVMVSKALQHVFRTRT